jgi:hypothetical protein
VILLQGMALQTVQVIDPVVRTLNSHIPKGMWVAKAIADGGLYSFHQRHN